MNLKGIKRAAGIFAVGALLVGCRGTISEKPPIHPNMNMDQQLRKEAQEQNNFFSDGRSMRQPVKGTVARGFRKADLAYYEGVDANSDWIANAPVEFTQSFLYRGKERYEIYCTPCHGITGDGQGIIMTGQYGYVPAPSFHQQRLREATDGEIYSAIYNGVRNMPSYAHQIKVEDRWAIVGYIRALQASQNITEDEITEYDINLDDLKAEYEAEQERLTALKEARSPADQGEVVATAARGEELITQYACTACHSQDGSSLIGPSWLNVYGSEGKVVTEDGESITITKNDEYIIESIVNPYAKVTDGYDPLMADAYGSLSEADLKSIVEYIKTLSDN
tara:strand:+ start:14883 stop:15890 length:1008 start_codon:yes stop_codon:yes gene_type:complete